MGLTIEPILIAIVATIPWVQHFAGLLPFSGQAILSSSYLLGAALAWIVGHEVQKKSSTQLGDVLFAALAIAAVISSGMAMYQWLDLNDPTTMNIWILSGSYSGRSVANMAQPNQLGTLFALGAVATAWWAWRGHVRGVAAWSMLSLCLIGVVMTQSRTAVLELALLLAAVWYWRLQISNRFIPAKASLLFFVFIIIFSNLGWIAEVLGIPSQPNLIDRIHTEVRPMQWLMFLDGIGKSPLVGYGWNLVLPAQLAADYHPDALNGFAFGQSHNLFIDFLLWTGIPIGLLLSWAVLSWVRRSFLALKQPHEFLYFSALAVVLLHSLLEYPLHYLYYLIPFAAIAGALGSTQKRPEILRLPRVALGLGLVSGCLVWSLLLSDSLAIEQRYLSMRLAAKGIRSSNPEAPPPIRLMDHMAAMIEAGGQDLTADLTDADLTRMSAVMDFHASAKNVLSYSAALAMRGRTAESQVLLDRVCRVVTEDQCRAVPAVWKGYQERFPALLAVTARGQ